MGTDRYGWRARVYDRVLEPMNAPLRRVARRQVDPPPGAIVLDLGCGTGASLAEYAAEGFRVVGVDTSGAMLDRARDRLGAGADLRLGDGSREVFENVRADLVLLSFVLHALDRAAGRSLLDDVARVLAPGGRLLVTEFGTGTLRFPRGTAMRAVTVLAELAAGPTHAGNARRFVHAGGTRGLAGPGWAVVAHKPTAGGNVDVTVLARA
ncbi:class I SAM-dependent methyltransferase [Agromyces sp. SYSU T00194]|uniref:class I SAM-dependent methyltransferase n=1 Tax=Agromyces chitinivorans TaxID=3158560 RepID=UPI00339122EF